MLCCADHSKLIPCIGKYPEIFICSLYFYVHIFVDLTLAILYLGLFYAMAVLGPALGYICGGLLLTVYTDFHAVDMDT